MIIGRWIDDINRRHTLRKLVFYVACLSAILLIALVWLQAISHLATVISVMGAGVALALHDVILSFAGWISIIVRRPYQTGDRIQMGNTKGDVIDISMFHTTMMEVGNWVDADQSTGRIAICPNSIIFREPVLNYTRGFEFIWNEIVIVVTFESNWQKAEQIMLAVAQEKAEEIKSEVEKKIQRMSRSYAIYYRHLTPIIYSVIADNGVKLTLRYLSNVRMRRSTASDISRKILDAFAKENDIGFAYPTYRIYRAGEEIDR